LAGVRSAALHIPSLPAALFAFVATELPRQCTLPYATSADQSCETQQLTFQGFSALPRILLKLPPGKGNQKVPQWSHFLWHTPRRLYAEKVMRSNPLQPTMLCRYMLKGLSGWPGRWHCSVVTRARLTLAAELGSGTYHSFVSRTLVFTVYG